MGAGNRRVGYGEGERATPGTSILQDSDCEPRPVQTPPSPCWPTPSAPFLITQSMSSFCCCGKSQSFLSGLSIPADEAGTCRAVRGHLGETVQPGCMLEPMHPVSAKPRAPGAARGGGSAESKAAGRAPGWFWGQGGRPCFMQAKLHNASTEVNARKPECLGHAPSRDLAMRHPGSEHSAAQARHGVIGLSEVRVTV